MSDFLAMGGYAWYVWMAYGAVALAIGIEQHHRARLRADQLAHQLRDARQQDARIEVGADELADLEEHRR